MEQQEKKTKGRKKTKKKIQRTKNMYYFGGLYDGFSTGNGGNIHSGHSFLHTVKSHIFPSTIA